MAQAQREATITASCRGRVRGAVLVTAAAALLLGACSSPSAAPGTTSSPPATDVRSACSLMSQQEAEAIYHAPVSPLNFCSTNAHTQSSQALYLSTGPQRSSLILTVSKSGAATAPTTPPGATPVTVGGTTAYWSVTPASGTGGSTVSTLTATQHGTVVSMGTQNLTEAQVEQAMALVLGRL